MSDSTVVYARVPQHLADSLRWLAASHSRTVSEELREAIRAALEAEAEQSVVGSHS